MIETTDTWTSPFLTLLFDDPGAARCLVAPDGGVLRANAEWLRATGFTPEEVLGADLVSLFPETRDMTLAMHARAREGHHVEVPRHAQRVNGRESWWAGSIDPVPMQGGMGLLVTAREVRPPERRGGPVSRTVCSEPVCGTLLDVVNDAVFFHDADTGAVIDVNRRAEEMYEATREELCAADVERFSAGEPPYTAREALAHLRAASAGTPQLFEWRARTRSGRLFWVEVNIARIAGGPCDRLVAVVRDVTDRKRSEEALRAANDRLRDADRRKDEFLGMLSHELRNPLAPIRNSIHILRRAGGGDLADRAKDVIERQTRHLARLVDDLLDVTRIARGKVELRHAELDVATLARRAADDHRALMQERGLELALDVPRTRAVVEGDETRLAQVLGNLLSNAAKFTPAGGRVTLSVRCEAAHAVVRVRDTGAGIPPELLGRVFDPFTQAKQTLARSEGGLGLGLALVKGLVALHGGDVAAASDGPGRGAEFTVTLPLAGPRPAASRAPSRDEPPAHAPRRVLVVDDNRDAAETLALLVTMLGHEAEVAYDGRAALARSAERAPDVVLCDIGLPHMDGYEVARQLRAGGGARMRLVAVSGYAQPEDVARALAAGFDGHVAKPADPDALARLLG